MNTFFLCLKIFLARILDVSLGVIRTVELVKDNTLKAVILAFLEVFIWFLIAKEALTTNEFNIFIAVFYSLGYATGTYIGSYLSKRFIKGCVGVQVVSSNINNNKIEIIKKEGYGISSLKMDGRNKRMLFIEVDKKKLNDLLSLLNKLDQDSFIIISDRKKIYGGYLT